MAAMSPADRSSADVSSADVLSADVLSAEPNAFESALFDHVALSVGDLDAMISFYERAFGFAVESRNSLPDFGIRTALLRHKSGIRLELAERAGSSAPVAHGSPAEAAVTLGYYHWAIEVADLDAAGAAAVAGGATLVVAPSTAARVGMRYSYLADFEGNLIELVSFRAAATARS
jgi:catechol 2,3-dioxygenase-like lactoylglutathione lyase family enzyme